MKRVTLANGIELDVHDSGPQDAPALIFLHGFPESHSTWRHQIAYFEKAHRCIAPDQRGYCGSSKPQDVSAYQSGTLIADVFQLADALGVERFTVVGHDWGGAIAWGVAIVGQASGRVERAVIANAPHPVLFQRLLWTSEVQRAASQYMRTFRDRANDDLVREQGLLGMLIKAFDAKFLSLDMEPAERARQLAEWQDRDAAFGMLNWYRASPIEVPAMDEPFAVPADWSPPPLPKLEIPVLVVWAEDDLALPLVNLDGLEDHVSDLTIGRVPLCGHFVTWQAPDAVNAAMTAFLRA